MALKKEIELDNGIILNYHRITSINKITNEDNYEFAKELLIERLLAYKKYKEVSIKNIVTIQLDKYISYYIN